MAKHFLIIVSSLIIDLLVCQNLFRSGFFNTQDNMHPLRLQQYEQCRLDGQIPCRYVNLAGNNCGYPLFNFYAPLSYEFALWIKTTLLNITGYINTLKLYYFFTTILGFIGIYCLAKKYTNTGGSLLSGILYTLAPYKAVNIYIRGAFAEYFALALIPWILFFIDSWENNTKSRVLYIIAISSILLSHNLTVILFGPLLLLFFVKKLIHINASYKIIFVIDTILGIAITSFFFLPALLERSLTTNNTMTTGYFSYIIHFVTLKQLFLSSFWGFGSSLWEPVDGMSFQIGYLHWLLGIITLYIAIKNKQYLPICLILISIFFLLLTHNQSTIFWNNLFFLKFVQFPWRFLGPAILGISLATGITIKTKGVQLLLSLSTILICSHLFYVGNWDKNLNDTIKFTGNNFTDQITAGLGDYWPNFGQKIKTDSCPIVPADTSDYKNLYFNKSTNKISGQSYAYKPTNETIPLVYFPGWRTRLNNQNILTTYEPEFGLITIPLAKGLNNYELVYYGTGVQHISNMITLLALFTSLFFVYKTKWQK